MVATTEQRVEEIHARIYQLNSSVGRSYQTPALCAQLRSREHSVFLEAWQCRLYVMHAFRRHLDRDLLKYCGFSKEFTRHATREDILRAIYHFAPDQLFKNVNSDKLVHNDWKLALEPAKVVLGQQLRIFLEFCRDRFKPGVVFSMPREQARVVGQEEFALVPLADAPPPFDEAMIVQQALAVVAADVCNPTKVKMGMRVNNHRFFRVVKGNIAGRFLMNNEVGADGVRVGVVELTLAGRTGDVGLFPQAKHQDILQLDMLSTLRLLGTNLFFESVLFWESSPDALIHLSLPDVGVVATRMRSLGRCGDADSLIRMLRGSVISESWGPLVARILQLQNSSIAGECWYDTYNGLLRVEDDDGLGGIEVSAGTLMDLVYAGVLRTWDSDIGELVVSINYEAVHWQAASGLVEGTRDCTGHIDLSAPQKHSKLALMMALVRSGWTAMPLKDIGPYHAEGLDKRFERTPTRSKLYFAVLLRSDAVLQKLAICASEVPTILHGMPESYYKLLLRIRGPDDVRKLNALLNGPYDTISDRRFAELLPPEEKPVHRGGADDGAPHNQPMLLDTPRGEELLDMARVHRMAAQVMRNIPAAIVDLRGSLHCDDDGLRIVVHLDNCSHASGKQRAYATCPVKSHVACFRYTFVHLFDSVQHAGAWLTSWGRHAADQDPKVYTKENHKAHQPDESWRDLVPNMCDVMHIA